MIGYIVIAMVLLPVIVLIGAFVLEKPRNFRVPALLLGSLAAQTAFVFIFLALFGLLLGLLIPQ
jgi:hypothetical protein